MGQPIEREIYIRVRLPRAYVRPIPPNPKQLTLGCQKFGIAGSVNDRNAGYMRTPDNGFMLYTFACNTRREAVIVEGILKHKFADLTLFGSREYVDAARLAASFGSEGSGGSTSVGVGDGGEDDAAAYASYVAVAGKLFALAVHWVKTISPDAYPATYYGKYYSIAERNGELEFDLKPISRDQAESMGIAVAPLAAAAAEQAERGRRASPMARTNGKVIARDVETGEETVYSTAGAAARLCGDLRSLAVGEKLLRDTYVDKKRQVGGRSWRSFDANENRWWVPPSHFVFSRELRNTGTTGYVVVDVDGMQQDVSSGSGSGSSSSSRAVYESIAVAAKLMQLDVRTVSDLARKGACNNGVRWSRMAHADAGRWSDDEEDKVRGLCAPYVPPTSRAVVVAKSGENARCYGRLIARCLSTGAETVHESANRLAVTLGVSPHALRETFCDKPRQIRGLHVRSIGAERRWQPSPRLTYDASGFEKSKKGYVASFGDPDDASATREPVALFESLSAAERESGGQIAYRIDTGAPCGRGHYWRYVGPDLAGAWVAAVYEQLHRPEECLVPPT